MSVLMLGAKPTNVGGVESVIFNLNVNLFKNGFRPTTLYMPCCNNKLFLSFKSFLSLQPLLRSRSLDFDLVHGHGDNCFFYSIFRQKKIPFVVTFHGTMQANLESIGHRNCMEIAYFSMPEKVAAEACDIAVACSKGVKDELVRLYGIPSAKVRVIHNGVDVKQFRPMPKDEARAKFGIRNDVFYGLWIGKQIRRKGLDVAIAACKIAKCGLLIGGTNGKSSGLIRYLGRVPNYLLALLYNAADFFIYPSRYEGHPIVCLEALASGLPLIVSKAAKVEIIDDGTQGYVISDVNDYQKFAERIKLLMHNAGMLEKMAKSARDIAKNFSWTIQTGKYIQIYKELL